MDKIYVVYWSQSGNTQAMAEAVGQGIAEAGKEAEVVHVGSASVDMLKDEDPGSGIEEINETEDTEE